MGSGRAGTGMQEQELQEVSTLVTFLMSIYTDYSAYTSRGLCRGECCPWEATTESSRMGAFREKCFVGAMVLTGVGQWVVAAVSGVCQVNDTSADFGWWGNSCVPHGDQGSSSVRPGVPLWVVGLELLTCWACVQHKCSVCLPVFKKWFWNELQAP